MLWNIKVIIVAMLSDRVYDVNYDKDYEDAINKHMTLFQLHLLVNGLCTT